MCVGDAFEKHTRRRRDLCGNLWRQSHTCFFAFCIGNFKKCHCFEERMKIWTWSQILQENNSIAMSFQLRYMCKNVCKQFFSALLLHTHMEGKHNVRTVRYVECGAVPGKCCEVSICWVALAGLHVSGMQCITTSWFARLGCKLFLLVTCDVRVIVKSLLEGSFFVLRTNEVHLDDSQCN